MKVFKANASEWFPTFDVYTVVGTDRCIKAAAEMGYGQYPMSDACTFHLEGENRCLVCISDKIAEEEDEKQVYAIIAHECVHAANAWCNSIGEDDPGEEEFAYMVQSCILAVFEGIEAERKRAKRHDA